MALTDPPPGQDHDTSPGHDDMPAGNSWRQTAGPTSPGLLGRIARACHRHRWLTLAGCPTCASRTTPRRRSRSGFPASVL
jgi:hypothetical protein